MISCGFSYHIPHSTRATTKCLSVLVLLLLVLLCLNCKWLGLVKFGFSSSYSTSFDFIWLFSSSCWTDVNDDEDDDDNIVYYCYCIYLYFEYMAFRPSVRPSVLSACLPKVASQMLRFMALYCILRRKSQKKHSKIILKVALYCITLLRALFITSFTSFSSPSCADFLFIMSILKKPKSS